MNIRQIKEIKMTVKISDALSESINDLNEILYSQKLIDKKEYERVSAQFPMAAVSQCQQKWMGLSLLKFAEN